MTTETTTLDCRGYATRDPGGTLVYHECPTKASLEIPGWRIEVYDEGTVQCAQCAHQTDILYGRVR